MTWLLFAAAGALGALARWGLDSWVSARLGRWLPWGVLTVNVLGCLLLGLVAGWAELPGFANLPPDAHRTAATGLLGSFTTFSTVFVDVVRMLGERRLAPACGYMVLSLALGVAALCGGLMISARGG